MDDRPAEGVRADRSHRAAAARCHAGPALRGGMTGHNGELASTMGRRAVPDRQLAARPDLDRPQPRAARAAGRDRQLVRAPAGQAPRRRAWRSPRWSRASRSTTATRRRTTELLRVHPDEHAGAARRAAALRPGPRRHARRPRPTCAEHVAGVDVIDLNMGCPVPKVCKTGAGAALLKDPDTAVAVARAAAEGSGLPVTVKLRSGQRPGDTERLRPRAPPRRRGRRRRDRLPPAQSPRCTTRACPTTTSPRELVESLGAPVILTGGLRTPEDGPRAPTSTRAPRR